VNAVIEHSAPQTALEIRSQVNRIQEVMIAVFKPDVHYGRIPGAGDKPVLFKPGAEKLCATFRIAPEYRIDDLGGSDEVRYRVTCVGRHQGTGIALGEGSGEASTNEEKYKWRSAVCHAEWEAAEVDRRRVKYKKSDGRSGSDHYTIEQVRTEPSDLANTVLKMAQKRALVAMTLVVTAASDCFTQDLEDMSPEVRDAVVESDAPRGKPATAAPQAAAPAAGAPTGCATPPQVKLLRTKLDQAGVPEVVFLDTFEINTLKELPFARVNDALAWIRANGNG